MGRRGRDPKFIQDGELCNENHIKRDSYNLNETRHYLPRKIPASRGKIGQNVTYFDHK